ncbi:unnamed protein product [Didymodactylos carnosus]|uniref:Uncharacterized protein n=1 Tax=Didymodactylos carnosus TaxID=1234261 RepID=A0A815IVU2_9BILA|nr:unnamed protein product [Didymodactylos carnosus]CAF1589669.1 unnamed protein product [Didymodactylos carnosus]CAF4257180.1 unnamed protein product [Didymodactylos carnosus]CAF4392960.1 unnamed protein product [Didymodactylos carnosus]
MHFTIKDVHDNWKIITVCFIVAIVFIIFWKREPNDRCVLSEAYPSHGPGCNIKCSNGYEYSSLTFYNVTTNWPSELVTNMYKATNILEKYGKPVSIATKNQHSWLHVTLHYYCCYSKQELVRIEQFLDNYKWTTQEIVFDRMICAISHVDKISIVLMADAKSQYNLLKLATDIENEMKTKMNIPIRISRSKLQKIHMTLGVVSRTTFPAWTAVKVRNKEIPPNTWHNQTIFLTKPPIR